MAPKFIDIHAHLNFAAFDADRDAAAKRALDAGVWVVNVGTQIDTSRKAVELAEKYDDGVYAIVGIHPIHTSRSFHDAQELGEAGKEFVSRGEQFDISNYKDLARHPKVVGIGECGLDYYRMEHGTWSVEHERQEEAFRRQIELALEVKRPLMLHVRNGGGRSAYRDALSILTSYNLNLKSISANFHFFAGSWEEAREILDAGFYLSFTGVITFARDYDEVVKNAPLDRILSETDSPYVAPAPYRGARNEPLYVREIVRKIADIRREPEEKVRVAILQNAERLFGIPIV